jgi:hypothetical protein
MADMTNTGMNYDAVFKEAMTLFKGKALDFLGLSDLGTIEEPLPVENVEVEIRSEFADMAFALRGGGGLHFEEEVNLSKDDLLRICGYHTWLSRVHKREFVTVLFVKNRVPAGRIRIRTKQLHFTPVVVDCSAIDADTRLARLRQQVQRILVETVESE